MYYRYSILIALLIITIFACSSKNHTTIGADTNNSSLEIKCSLSSYHKNISAPFIGFNTNTIKGPKWTDKQLQEILQKFHPQFLRYPGGTVSSIWDWKKGGFVDNLPEEALEDKEFSNREIVTATLEEFKTAIDATKATPVFVLNMVTSDLNNQIAMLKHAKQIGLVVKYIEMGNEYYKSQHIFTSKFPSPADYAKEAVLWATEIKKEFSDAEFAVIATRQGQDKDERLANWNQGVFEGIKNEKIIDAITIHPYSGPGHGIKELKDAMTINDMSNILGASFNGTFLIDVNPPQGKKIWITEYNVFDVKKNVMNSRWVHGLYIANMTLDFLNNPDVEMILYHSLIGNPSFRAIFTGKNDLAKLESTTPTKPFDYTAAGYAYSIILNTMIGKDEATRLGFSSNITESSFNKSYNAIIGWNFKGKSGPENIFLNLSKEEVIIDVAEIGIQDGKTYHSYSVVNPVDLWINSDAIINKEATVKNHSIVLPAYSIIKL